MRRVAKRRLGDLIFLFVRFLDPLLEGALGIVIGHLDHGNAPRGRRHGDLAVDEGIVEARGAGVSLGRGEEDVRGPGPEQGAQTHGARLARCVNITAGQPVVAKHTAGFADGHDFGVGGRVVSERDAVGSGGDDDTVSYHQRSEWATVAAHVVDCQVDYLLNQRGFHEALVESPLPRCRGSVRVREGSGY
jgi:hypothetical protein